MSYNDKPPKMSEQNAAELAKRLHSVLTFEAIPNELYVDIAASVNELFNHSMPHQHLVGESRQYINDVLLAYTGNAEAIGERESTLPELISQVMNHPDLPREAKTKLGDVFIEIGNEIGNWGSPEHFAAMLGIKAQKFSPKKKGKK